MARVETEFHARVRAVLLRLDPGEVVTYGEVAEEAGSPNGARAVGQFLSRADGVPWWRVVMSNGQLAPGKEPEQARLLEREGVTTRNGRVVRSGTRRPRF